jgi:hypothetical protein
MIFNSSLPLLHDLPLILVPSIAVIAVLAFFDFVFCHDNHGVVLTTHPLLAPRSLMSGAIPLLPLWVFGACYRVNFTTMAILSVSERFYKC